MADTACENGCGIGCGEVVVAMGGSGAEGLVDGVDFGERSRAEDEHVDTGCLRERPWWSRGRVSEDRRGWEVVQYLAYSD